jgi:hypothetical protein
METTIGLDSALCKIVESMLPTGTPDKCLLITINISKHNLKKDTIERELFNIIAYRPTSYTYIGESDGYFSGAIVGLKQHSYHASCWRSDGIHDCIKQHQEDLDSRTLKTDSQFVNIETIKLVDGYVDIKNDMFIKQ